MERFCQSHACFVVQTDIAGVCLDCLIFIEYYGSKN